MKNRYLAKTRPEKTIWEHTNDLLTQYDILKELYPNILDKEEWELLLYAAKFHDLGKMNTKFQNKLYQKLRCLDKLIDTIPEEEVPHNFLSPFFINTKEFKEKYGAEDTQILVSAVYYHHDRTEIDYDDEAVSKDLKLQLEGLGPFFDLPLNSVKKYSERYLIRDREIEDIALLKCKKYIMIKGLLNKLDYVASLDKEGVNVEESSKIDGMNVADKIKEITKNKYQSIFRPVQKYMMENKEENLIVVSPTGSGKTEACLLWIGESKAFYTLPLKVSINAIYERIIGPIQYKKALLLHSDAYSYYQNTAQEELNSYDRARRMAAPLIVTTVDQLFKIAFRYKGYEEILATLSYSKVIIDEIQMYSPDLLAYILLGLKMITQLGGKFAIVTATFPPVLYEFMNYLKIEYKQQKENFPSHIAIRHKIKVLKNSEMKIENIKESAKEKKVLVIVNTIKKAQELYEKLKGENVFLLHSQYLKEDKKNLEEAILKFSDREKNNENGIWISTQIVEASLDIDFDILYTDMCTIDSLFQRMGRVYRKRKYEKEEPNILIYDNKNGGSKVIDSEIYKYSLEEILKYDNKELTEEDKQTMIENIFNPKLNKELTKSKYYNQIKNRINLLEEAIPNTIQKKEIERLFRDIQNVLLIPDNIYEKFNNSGKIEEWNQILGGDFGVSEKIKIKDEIAKYTVSVPWNFKLEYDKEELFYSNSNIHRTKYQYEFDADSLQGKGLIKEAKEDNFDD